MQKKYGLQIRVPPSQQKQQATRPPIPKLPGFNNDDDNIEEEISRQASKNKSLRVIEEQHNKALEEDPSIFDYDGVYDEMKNKASRPRMQDRQERQPKYIQALMDKAKQREREQEIIYERKIAKERSKDDHLYEDKDKFVTRAYKNKLAEQAKWLEEERLRELREKKDDVTNKSDISDFYFNLSNNVAFGAMESKSQKPKELEEKPTVVTAERGHSSIISPAGSPSGLDRSSQGEPASLPERSSKPVLNRAEEEVPAEQAIGDQPRRDYHKRREDALAAAKERFLARKKAKEQ